MISSNELITAAEKLTTAATYDDYRNAVKEYELVYEDFKSKTLMRQTILEAKRHAPSKVEELCKSYGIDPKDI